MATEAISTPEVRPPGERPPEPARPDMVWIAGGTFRMGSDRHYPEEAPVHHVHVDGFWIDRTPGTNRQFRAFVQATGYRTFGAVVGALLRFAIFWRTHVPATHADHL